MGLEIKLLFDVGVVDVEVDVGGLNCLLLLGRPMSICSAALCLDSWLLCTRLPTHLFFLHLVIIISAGDICLSPILKCGQDWYYASINVKNVAQIVPQFPMTFQYCMQLD